MTNELPPDAVGHVMDPGVVALRSDWSVHKTVGMLRGAPQGSLYYLYVTDAEAKLVGIVSMRHLLLAQSTDKLETIMSRDVTAVRTDQKSAEVLEIAERKKFVAFPVVDAQGKLVGAIRPNDVVAIAEAQAGSMLQRFFGAGGDEKALSSVTFALKKRLPWLQFNLATAFLASAVVAIFESTIDRVTALAVLLPIVAGQGGNAGAQALAVVIRGIAVGEIAPGQTMRVLLKEMVLGLLNGVSVAIVCALAVLAWYRQGGIALVIGIAMVVNMVAAGISGAGIPLLMKALKRDPAQSGSIIMTTVTDVVGFLSFLGLATVLLRGSP